MESKASNEEIVQEQDTVSGTTDQADATSSAESVDAEVVQPGTAGELEKLRRTAEENYTKFLRTQADFDNFRRRTRTEKEEMAKYASSKVIEALLPTLDNLERAVSSSKTSSDLEALQKGVEMVLRQFTQVLQSEGLQAVETVGKPFDPMIHQAVMQVNDDSQEDGIVVEELQKGYQLKDKVIRPAMVKVNQL